jgi:hypothetical protein
MNGSKVKGMAAIPGSQPYLTSQTTAPHTDPQTTPQTNSPETTMSDAAISSLTLESLRDVLQQCGLRAEILNDPATKQSLLRSATGGLAFDLRPGNRIPGRDQEFVDALFVAVLQVQGEMPMGLINRWNATRRFARLHSEGQFMVLAMDVTVAGGVMPIYLRGQLEIWDRVVNELVVYLREELPKLSRGNGADTAAGARSAEARLAPATA